jgi:hypothetical protein
VVLTREDLDRRTCDVPGCTETHGPLWLHGSCHPNGTLSANYHKGVLTLICAVCGTVVTRMKVASLPDATERRANPTQVRAEDILSNPQQEGEDDG